MTLSADGGQQWPAVQCVGFDSSLVEWPHVMMELERTLQMRRSELDRYLVELPDQATWIEGTKHLLADYRFGSRQPWPHYRGEEQVWV